ncbi:MAG: FecR domain-containing protein [Tunicatimonas sp.]|uniref:FecR family protein n=1 Tax=Tunicatimonas sp. TaxID=1940096 RepID=UPI003C756E37
MDDRSQGLKELLLDDRFIAWVLHPTPALNQYWNNWQKERSNGKVLVAEAQRLIHQMQVNSQLEPLREPEVQQMWQKLQNRHAETHNIDDKKSELRWYGVAASISVLLAFAIFLFIKISEPATITHQTDYGETKHVVLPDSSSVLLNANSSITYWEDWLESSERNVTLNGEAFFEVYHTQDHRQFLVHTNAVSVEVLGTSFNVLNRRNRTQVVLKEGEVLIKSDSEVLNNDIVMQPGELVEVEGNNYIQHPVQVETYTTWMQDEHIFDGTTLAEIAQLVEDIYGLEVRIENKNLLNKKFTGRIDRGDLTSLFGQLEKVFPLSIEHKGNSVTIH